MIHPPSLTLALLLLVLLTLAVTQRLRRADEQPAGRPLLGRVARPIARVARLAARRLPPPLVTTALRLGATIAASRVDVVVLVDDRTLRRRLHRQLRAALDGCVAALGAPADRCTVIVVRRVERDGRPLAACVERLSSPDGTSRTVISLALQEGSRALSYDAIAARLAGYYPVVASVERSVLIADATAATASTAVAPAAPPTPPATTRLAPAPSTGVAAASPLAGLNGGAGRR